MPWTSRVSSGKSARTRAQSMRGVGVGDRARRAGSCALQPAPARDPARASSASRSAASSSACSASRQNAAVSSARAHRPAGRASAGRTSRSDRAGRRWRRARPALRRRGSPAPAGVSISASSLTAAGSCSTALASLPSAPARIRMPPWNDGAAAAGRQAAPEQVAARVAGDVVDAQARVEVAPAGRRAARRWRAACAPSPSSATLSSWRDKRGAEFEVEAAVAGVARQHRIGAGEQRWRRGDSSCTRACASVRAVRRGRRASAHCPGARARRWRGDARPASARAPSPSSIRWRRCQAWSAAPVRR